MNINDAIEATRKFVAIRDAHESGTPEVVTAYHDWLNAIADAGGQEASGRDVADLTLQLGERVAQLEEAIATHAAQKGHDRCRLDDEVLYKAAGLDVATIDTTLPPEDDFIEGCRRFWKMRQSGVSYEHCSLVEVQKQRDAAHEALRSIVKNLALRRAVAQGGVHETQEALRTGAVPKRLLNINSTITLEDLKRYEPVEMKLLHDLSGIMSNVGYALDKADLRALCDEAVAWGREHAHPKPPPEKEPG